MRLNQCWVLLWVLFSVSVSAQQRVAFVTSVNGNADLSSWEDAGSNTGLAAGDAICQARASVAGLANPANFVALLSDTVDDAYCRLTGHSGKKADLCGQASLPLNAGPWVNMMGENFAEGFPEMLSPDLQVYRTLRFNEFGEAVSTRYFTGSNDKGALYSENRVCEDWTSSTAAYGSAGSSDASGSGVFSVGINSCGSNLPLACFEMGVGDPLVAETPLGSLAFVTSERGQGDLSTWPSANGEVGINAADEICQSAAFDAGLAMPEEFIAWISDDFVNAIDRFEYTGPWFRLDGVVVAHSLAELASGQLNAPNNVTENMFYFGNIGVWTGTNAFGVAHNDNCQNWQSVSNNDNGLIGVSHYANTRFTEHFNSACHNNYSRLYCFHNVALDLIFKNGLE